MSRFVLTIDRPLNDDFPALVKKINGIPGFFVKEPPTLTTIVIDYKRNSSYHIDTLRKILSILISNVKVDKKAGVYGTFTLVDMVTGVVICYESSKKKNNIWMI